MLTAKTSEADKLRGFRLGVDDYITKPFSMAEMAARIKAVIARSQADGVSLNPIIQSGPLRIDSLKREVLREGEVVTLTPTEFRLLQVLAERLGQAVPREELIESVWGDYRLEGGSALRRYIWFLRQKIEKNPEDPKRIVTVRGYGYRLEP
jgi:two-component system KDP operon response regulator KdpE